MVTRTWKVLILSIVAGGAIGTARSVQPPAPDATARAVKAAEAFLSTLDARQRAKANIDLNEQTRVVWSNLPTGTKMQVGATERNGLKLGDMTPPQEKAALALLSATLSAEGYEKALAVVGADQVLEDQAAAKR